MENINYISTPTAEDLMDWMKESPMSRVLDTATDLEGHNNYMDDALDILEVLMGRVVNEACASGMVTLSKIEAKALYGALTYIQTLHQTMDKSIQDLNKAAFAARKKTTDETLGYTRMITDKSIEEINRLNLGLDKHIEDLNRMNLKLEEAGIPID